MAFTVCQDVVTAEGGQSGSGRTVFTELDPAVAIDVAAAATRAQVTSIYTRFFLEAPSSEEVADSLSLLGDVQTMSNSRGAWRGLCAAYLASMRFLTY
jgi:hypothetical protein